MDITPGTPSNAPAVSDQRLTASCIPVAIPVMFTANSAAIPPRAFNSSDEKPRFLVSTNAAIAMHTVVSAAISNIFIPVDKTIPSFQFIADCYIAAFEILVFCHLE